MGYGGRHVERERARELRADSRTLQEIADELGVAKGTVSVWVSDVEFTPRPRNRGHSSHRPHPLHLKKLAEIERCRVEAEQLLGNPNERELDAFALGLYAGEGSKTGAPCRWRTRTRDSFCRYLDFNRPVPTPLSGGGRPDAPSLET